MHTANAARTLTHLSWPTGLHLHAVGGGGGGSGSSSSRCGRVELAGCRGIGKLLPCRVPLFDETAAQSVANHVRHIEAGRDTYIHTYKSLDAYRSLDAYKLYPSTPLHPLLPFYPPLIPSNPLNSPLLIHALPLYYAACCAGERRAFAGHSGLAPDHTTCRIVLVERVREFLACFHQEFAQLMALTNC